MERIRQLEQTLHDLSPRPVAASVATTAVAGSLALELLAGLHACRLCYVQRYLMAAVVVLLAIDWVKPSTVSVGGFAAVLCVLAGIALASYQSLEPVLLGGLLDCPACHGDPRSTILGVPIPYLSLFSFVTIGGLVMLSLTDERISTR